ncbi:alkyl hydroperoxide reductase [Salinarchaeum sp. Harcht-Bsk1]|uniref:thioredoxin family protein n=1 Tax=Salinarchaeum sp. Harcht-Bsk1 TaxID=1333523 RepID=UPI0003423E9A|nr:thioredoxin family protein [Salinarchaeum sp. Harcht-Bsk1]AGN02844.1 alkyl hydroperoxide reductase [Salinarchaeum sp. Harcht-Bsk1]
MAGESIDRLETGDSAPSFELPGTDGRTYSLDSFDDATAVLVVFTCNHCPYAQAKHPLLNDLAAEYDDVSVVGINPNDPDAYPEDSFESMQEAVESGEVAYDAYLFDESQSVAASYGAVCTPDPFLFDNGDGEFQLAYHAQLDDALNPDDEATRVHIREAIDAVRGGDPVDVDGQPSRGCTIKWRDGNEPEYWDQI